MDLFADQMESRRLNLEPLALRMRPRTLDEFVGQSELVGPGRFLRRVIESDSLPSLLFFGPQNHLGEHSGAFDRRAV